MKQPNKNKRMAESEKAEKNVETRETRETFQKRKAKAKHVCCD